jgi:hypothetical protein
MASDDRPKLPRVTVRDEKLYVEGEKEPYFQDREHILWLRVNALSVHRGYEAADYTERAGNKVLKEFLFGTVTLEGDRFAVIGLETDRKTSITFKIGPISDAETEHHWQASIGFYDSFYIDGFCTRQYFDDLVTAVRRGHVHDIRVGMETLMWTRDKPPFFGNSTRTWHLAPPIDDDDAKFHANEYGNISSLMWQEFFAAPKMKDDDVTAPKPQLVELPARVYSMLSALLAIAAALLVLTFLR